MVLENAEFHLRCTRVTPAFTLRSHTNAFGRFSPRSFNAFQVFRALVDFAFWETYVVAAIAHGGLHSARFPVHLYSAPANVTGVHGPRGPGPEIGEQFHHRGLKRCPRMSPLLVADHVYEVDFLGVLRLEVAPLRWDPHPRILSR